jgi:hypothetical protein
VAPTVIRNKASGSGIRWYELRGLTDMPAVFQQGAYVPSDLDGTIAPPAGAPNAFVNFGTNSLDIWKFHVDWANPVRSFTTTGAKLFIVD